MSSNSGAGAEARAREAQYRYNTKQARKQAKQGIYDTAMRLEDYAVGANRQLGTAAATLGKLGALDAGRANNLVGNFGDISRPTTDIAEISGFDPEKYNKQVADWDNRVAEAKAAYESALETQQENQGLSSDDDSGSSLNFQDPVHQTWNEYRRLEDERDDFIGSQADSRDKYNRLSTNLSDAMGEVGQTEISTPQALKHATGSDLLNLSRGLATMRRDRAKILSMGLQASDNALEAGQHYSDQGDFAAATAEAQEKQAKQSRILSGITGALGLIGGGLITGGALWGAGAFGAAMGKIGAGTGISFMTSGGGRLGSSFI